ncbi:porin family protein [Marinomonas sp.]|nr:autotransporter outer membrane beta-barrel domain-containing protein [Marinomonas sp.]MDB4838219.1 porin family protein [Marinomonas sp.]
MKKIVLSSVMVTMFSLFSVGANAGLFDILEYSAGQTDAENGDSTYNSFSAAFQLPSPENVFIAFDSTEIGNTDNLAIGGGYYFPFGPLSSLFGTFQLVDTTFSSSTTVENVGTITSSDSDTGFRIQVGIRNTLTDYIELEGKVRYTDGITDEADTSFVASFRFYVTENFSVAANYDTIYEQDVLSASVRWAYSTN